MHELPAPRADKCRPCAARQTLDHIESCQHCIDGTPTVESVKTLCHNVIRLVDHTCSAE